MTRISCSQTAFMQQQTINIHLILMKNQLVQMCNLFALFLDDELNENLRMLAK